MAAALATPDRTVGDFTSRGAIPRVYGEALVEVARDDPRVVCLVADLSPATETDLFRDMLPDRFHNLGIAEANMMGAAGGMARSGERPFVHTFGVFATRRSYDQVAMQIA
jgi:transketolase